MENLFKDMQDKGLISVKGKVKEHDHLSHTQIGMWLRCPRQWYYRYIEGLKIPPPGAIILGSSYHIALAVNFIQKIETEVDMPTDDVLDAYSDSFDKRVCEENIIDWEDQNPGVVKDQGAGLVKIYQKEQAPKVIPIEVEQEYKATIANTELVGIIDLIKNDFVVADHKTSVRAYNQDDVDRDIQATCYAFLLGIPIDFEFHVAVKTKQPKIQIVQTSRTQKDIAWWVDMVTDISKLMKTGIAPPNPNGWHCSPKFCGYWQICHGG